MPRWKKRLIRWSILLVSLVLVIYVGLYVGYSVIGGQPGGEVFQATTWKHLFDLIFSDPLPQS